MLTHQMIDELPVALVFIVFAIVSLAMYEIGFRVGRWWQARTPGEQEGPTGVLVGSILALLAFLLAVTMGMASDRFDTRRGLVLDEANAIGTTYLRAGYLPEPASGDIRNLLREYVPLRISTSDLTTLAANIKRSQAVLHEIWAISEEVARTTDKGDVTALYLESVNETIDLNTSRVTAGVYARVPETIVWLLIGGSVLTLAMVGYSAGTTGQRSVLSAVVLVIALGAVITLVIDLDRPRDGFIVVSQQPLINLQEQLGPPS
jgi:hypothetical protein